MGANNDVMWLYAPGRVNNLTVGASGPSGTITSIAADYPGDKYVDLVGASVYLRQSSEDPSFATSFAATLSELEAVSTRPVFLPEIGSIETDPSSGADTATLKAQWITNTMAGILADPRIIGFVWFNNVASVTGGDGTIANDWRFNSSQAAQTAFAKAVGDPRFAAGMMPDAG